MEQHSLIRHEDAVSATGDVLVGGVCMGRRQPRHRVGQRGGRTAASLVCAVLANPRPGCAGRGLSGGWHTNSCSSQPRHGLPYLISRSQQLH